MEVSKILEHFIGFAIYVIVYHLTVRYVFGCHIVYMKVEDYERLETIAQAFRYVFWWVEYL